MVHANRIAVPTLLTQEELCRFLGKSKAWAERGRLEGYGPKFIRIGRSIRYDLSDVTEWVNANKWASTSAQVQYPELRGGK